MSQGAQSWVDTWESGPSTRKPIWGYSAGIYNPRRPAHDPVLTLPALPGSDLKFDGSWNTQNARRLQVAADALADNDQLLGLLHENLRTVEWNRYNLEVYISIASLYRQNLEMLLGIGRMCSALNAAQRSAAEGKPQDATESMDRALEIAHSIRRERNEALNNAIATWYKSWMPRVAEANGRKFLHELDDVKDHVPDRTVDMTYLVGRELQLPFGDWVAGIIKARNQYAAAHQLPADSRTFDWQSTETAH
jgi:hypothetical protein